MSIPYVEPCDCGFDVVDDICADAVMRHCCEHKKPLVSPDCCEDCLDVDDYLGADV